jgi:NADH-quinone oxidoreductase subunit G
MITVTIDDKNIQVPKGTTILKAALELGIDIPHLCYHEALAIRGTCRLCLVEVEKIPKLQTACSTVCTDGMVVRTNSGKVARARAGVLEFLLINHPLDCPICDKAGECSLQKYVRKYAAETSRFKETKRVHSRVDLGDTLVRNMDRCLACARCIRFTRDIAGIEEYGVYERGSHLEVGIMGGGRLANAMQGCLVDLCPVGALTSKDFRFKARVWTLDERPSICHRCAAGCNSFIGISKKNGTIKRIRPRENSEINKIWMCDLGRLHYHDLERASQVQEPLKRSNGSFHTLSVQAALDLLAAQIKEAGGGEKVAVIVGAGAGCQEAAAVKRFNGAVAPDNIIALTRREDIVEQQRLGNFLIQADWGPNMAGLKKMKIGDDLAAFKKTFGKIKVAMVLGCDIFDQGLPPDLLEYLNKVAFNAVFSCRLTEQIEAIAHLVIPAPHWSQMSGTFVNAKGIAQVVEAARPAVCPQVSEIIARLASMITGEPALSRADLDNDIIRITTL